MMFPPLCGYASDVLQRTEVVLVDFGVPVPPGVELILAQRAAQKMCWHNEDARSSQPVAILDSCQVNGDRAAARAAHERLLL
jgi:hypothetical protein